MRLRAHIERESVYRKRLRLYRNAARYYIVQTPLITAYAELPHPGGSLLVGMLTDYSAFPWGKGDRSRKARVDEGCFRLTWASDIVTLTMHRVFKLGYDSQVRFLGLA